MIDISAHRVDVKDKILLIKTWNKCKNRLIINTKYALEFLSIGYSNVHFIVHQVVYGVKEVYGIKVVLSVSTGIRYTKYTTLR